MSMQDEWEREEQKVWASAEQIRDELVPGAEGVEIAWPQNAQALHRRPSAYILSARRSTSCPRCDESVGFTPVRVEGEWDGCVFAVSAMWSRQHGCGGWTDEVWHAVPIDASMTDLHDMLAQVREEARTS